MGVKVFLEGGIASVVAGCSTHPLDLIKVRMQLQGEQNARPAFAFLNVGAGCPAVELGHQNRLGPISVGIRVVQREGVSALYSGVSATMLRQGLYSTTSMGLYEILKEKWRDPGSKSGNLPLVKKITAGLIAGGIGASVGNPADVAMVRMQADGRLPVAQRRNYRSVADAIGRMVRQEGVTSLWTGSSLTIQRAMIVTASQLASYDQIKETIISRDIMKDGLGTHVTASLSAGFVAAVASNPVDVIKTRIMNMNPKPGQPAPYSGALDCAMKTIKAEGPMALYKGFIPIVTRQGASTTAIIKTSAEDGSAVLQRTQQKQQRFKL